MPATPSKGVRDFRKERAKEIMRLRQNGLSYKEIASNLCMDKSNVRRTYLNGTKTKKAIN